MLPGSSNANPSARSKSPDVSRNTSSIPQSDRVDTVVSNQPAHEGLAPSIRIPARSATLSSVPDPVGSFVPPLVMATAGASNRQNTVANPVRIACACCG
jgi:hypothetical protein